jgi:hypothetical protein
MQNSPEDTGVTGGDAAERNGAPDKIAAPSGSGRRVISSLIVAILLLSAAAAIGGRAWQGLPVAHRIYEAPVAKPEAKPVSLFQAFRRSTPVPVAPVQQTPGYGSLSTVAASLPDYDALRQEMEGELRDDIGATPAEWAALEPVIAHIQELQWQLTEASPLGGLFPVQPPLSPPAAFAGRSSIDEAIDKLRSVVGSPDSTADNVQYRVRQVQKARAEVTAQLGEAQNQLKKIATPKEQAMLMADGILE